MRAAVAVTILVLVAGCSSGPVYRGAPPPGMTDAEYRCKLAAQRCPPSLGRWAEMKDDGSGKND